MKLTVHHKRQRHAWGNPRMRRNWRIVLFSDESRFTLKFADGRLCVWRQPGEGFAEACVMPIDHFGCGSLMVCGGVHYAEKTNLIMIRPTQHWMHSATVMTFYALLRCRSCAETLVLSFNMTMRGYTPLVSPWTFYRPTMLAHYPGRSPDLADLIEHVWDMLNRLNRKNHHPFNS